MYNSKREMLRLAGWEGCRANCFCQEQLAESLTPKQMMLLGNILRAKSPAYATAVDAILEKAGSPKPSDQEMNAMLNELFNRNPELALLLLFGALDDLGRNMSQGGPRRPDGDSADRHRHHRKTVSA